MSYIINDPVAPMRESPAGNSKVVSQALFGEEIGIENTSGDWLLIKTPDGYCGWVASNSLVFTSSAYKKWEVAAVSGLAGPIYSVPDIEFGPIKTVPYGSKLRVIEEIDSRWMKILNPDEREAFIQKGDIASEKTIKNKKGLIGFSKRFLGLPYIWGGRSSFGYDCSGFVQMLYGRLGILLPRDSKDQVQDSRFFQIPLEKIEPGDLLFFGKDQEKIHHVGLSLGGGKFIHASAKENRPYLRISKLSDFAWSGAPDCAYPFRTALQLRR